MLEILDHDSVRELRLNRPPANALSPELMDSIRFAVESAEPDGAEALVLSGRPGMFSAGLDVPYLLTLDRDGISDAWRRFLRLLGSLATCPVPIAGALTGHSPAGGAVLSLFFDYRVMAEGPFKIGFNEVQVGIVLPVIFQRAIAGLVGRRHAARIGMAGLMIDAAEAHSINLVDELLPVEEVVPRAIEWCGSILALPRKAMLGTRANARRQLIDDFREVPESALEALVKRWFSDETQRALRGMVARLAAGKAAG
ncbi:MAG: enoyl-CoA hydratase/isomerase family protein [bacterium]|nr:enoyl-CoA hydratase/isomerase family protein [bacterium]